MLEDEQNETQLRKNEAPDHLTDVLVELESVILAHPVHQTKNRAVVRPNYENSETSAE